MFKQVALPISGQKKTILVTPGVIDTNAEHAYRYGQCLALALALYEYANYPIVLAQGWLPEDQLNDNYDEIIADAFLTAQLLAREHGGTVEENFDNLEKAIYEENCRAVHFAVRLPDDRLLDITGPHQEEVFLTLPHLFNARPEDLQVMDTIPPPKHNDDIETARKMVPALLAKYHLL